MDDLTRIEIQLGSNICNLIKQIYYRDEKWGDVRDKITSKFSSFKKILRKFYPDCKNNVELLKKVNDFGLDDIEDIFNLDNKQLRNERISANIDLSSKDRFYGTINDTSCDDIKNVKSLQDEHKNDVKMSYCDKCGYVYPFCRHSTDEYCSM